MMFLLGAHWRYTTRIFLCNFKYYSCVVQVLLCLCFAPISDLSRIRYLTVSFTIAPSCRLRAAVPQKQASTMRRSVVLCRRRGGRRNSGRRSILFHLRPQRAAERSFRGCRSFGLRYDMYVSHGLFGILLPTALASSLQVFCVCSSFS